MALPVAGHRHRIDRVYTVAGRDQRLHPRTPVGLDTDPHPPGGLARFEIGPLRRHVLGDQRMQPGDALKPFR